jgi:hypothetical protein
LFLRPAKRRYRHQFDALFDITNRCERVIATIWQLFEVRFSQIMRNVQNRCIEQRYLYG